MRKKKQKNDFVIETIDLTPSNNLTSNSPQDYNLPPVPYDDGTSERMNEYRFTKKMGRKVKKNLIVIILFFVCAYLLFLISGALLTEYYVDSETGTRQPIFVTYSDVVAKNDYKTLKTQFTGLRNILIEVRITEIKYEDKEIDEYEAANRYENILQEVDLIIPKLSAINVNSERETIKTSMSSCYTTYLAGYLQEMHKGLTTSDAKAVNSALEYRKLMLQSYSDTEIKLKELAESLKLSDEYFNWNLDEAVAEKDPTAVLKNK